MITSLNISFFFFFTSWTSSSCFCADINSGFEFILNKKYVINELLSYIIHKQNKYRPTVRCLLKTNLNDRLTFNQLIKHLNYLNKDYYIVFPIKKDRKLKLNLLLYLYLCCLCELIRSSVHWYLSDDITDKSVDIKDKRNVYANQGFLFGRLQLKVGKKSPNFVQE